MTDPSRDPACSQRSHDRELEQLPAVAMSDLANRKVFKVFNQEFVVDERYNVTKELGQGAYGIVW